MPRPRKLIRPVKVHIVLPEDIYARVQLDLWSAVEGRVPVGALSDVITALLRHALDTKGNLNAAQS